MSLIEIDALFSYKCNYTHNTCKMIANKITEFHNNDMQVTNDFFTSYLLYIDSVGQHYFEKCIGKKDICIPVIKKILEYLTPTEENIMILSKIPTKQMDYYKNYDESCNGQLDIFKAIINKKIKIPTKILETILLEKNLTLAHFLINYVNPDEKCLEAACACENSYSIINLIIAQKIPVSEKAIINAIKLKNETSINLLFQMGFCPNERCLVEACRIQNEEIINRILLCKVMPTQQCFNALIDFSSLSFGRNKQATKALHVATLIDILIQNGYNITYDDVHNALLKGCYINNILRFDIKFDGKFVEECTRIGFHPYTNLGIQTTLNCLYTESKRVGNVPTLRKIISQGLKPDIECLRHACDNKSNIQNIKYLVEVCNIKPNLDCLKTIAKHIGNTTLIYLLNNFQETIPTINNKQEEKETNIDKQLIVPINLDNDHQQFTEIKSNEKNNDDANKENDVVNNISKKILNKVKDKLNVDVDNDTEDDIEDIHEHTTNTPEIKKYDTIKIKSNKLDKINKRNKYLLSHEAIKILELNKETKLTFLDTRKCLVAYINKNNLIDTIQKNLIKPNNELIKLLKIKKNQYIDFGDVDDIVCLMLKI